VKAIEKARDAAFHGAGRSCQRTPVEGDRVRRRTSAADEVRSVGVPLHGSTEPPFDAEHVEGPQLLFFRAAGTPGEEQTCALRRVLGLDKQLSECRMCEVVFRTSEDDFGKARHLDLTRALTVVGDRQPADLDIVFR
jgi:hypothetical protein